MRRDGEEVSDDSWTESDVVRFFGGARLIIGGCNETAVGKARTEGKIEAAERGSEGVCEGCREEGWSALSESH